MANWRNQFRSWILARGQEYFECGQVMELKETDTVIRAKVSGSREYRVEILRKNGRVTQMTCDCPYAAGGGYCKHMAAVLMVLEDEREQSRLDWKDALARMTETQIRELLYSVAAENGALQDRIARMVSGPGDDPAQWQDDLDQIISNYTDYDNWLNYDHAYDCMVEVAEYLEDCLPPLLMNGQVVDAAKLVMTVYGAAWNQEMDDSDGGLTVVSAHCRDAMVKILSLSDAAQERKIFYLLHNFMEDSDWDYGSEDLEDLILSLDWSAELQQKNLEWLDENLDSWRMSQRADLMKRMGTSTAEIIAWWEQYRNDDTAYHPLLRLYEEHDLPKAIELVRSEREKAETPWQRENETKTLLGLLGKAEEQAQYENELRYLVLDLKCQETEYLSQLRQITPAEQWPRLFSRLLADANHPAGRMSLYHFEKMYDLLYAELTQYPSFGSFQSYEEELRGWNAEQTLKLYVELLKREMDQANQRKQYRYLIRFLGSLNAYPGGQAAAQTLAAYWHAYHKNRPAMREELRKAGYPE